jgi:hypothetical protein
MFAAALLLATYTTFGPIAQTERNVFVAVDDGSVLQRIVKDADVVPFALAQSPYRIAAVDVDGDDVLYGTSVRRKIKWQPLLPGDMAFQSATIELVDTEPVHTIERIAAIGGAPQTLVSALRGVTQLAHDTSWIYWLEPSSGTDTAPAPDAAMRRVDKSGLIIETIASGLTVPYSNQHPFVLAGDDVYINSGDQLLRVSKSGGAARAVAETRPGSSIAITGDTIHFVRAVAARQLQVGSDVEIASVFPMQVTAATWADTILGAAPGLQFVQVGRAVTGLALRDAQLLGACAPNTTARVLPVTSGNRSHLYFIDPLAAPPTAIDDRGVWMRNHRAIDFASPPEGCVRRRTSRP